MLKPICQLIAEAQVDLGLQDDNSTPIFKYWAYEAMREIGTTTLDDRTTDWILIENNEFCKPKDMLAPTLIQISKDDLTRCVEPKMAQNVEKNGCCRNTKSSCEIQIEEKATTFWLSSNNHYEYARIHYLGIPVDPETGDPMIDERAQRAVKQYITYKWLSRIRRNDRSSANAIPQSEIEAEYDRWVRLRKEAMGRISMPNVMQMYEVGQANLQSGLTLPQFSYRWNYWWSTVGAFAR